MKAYAVPEVRSRSHIIYFKKNTDCDITSDDHELVFEIDYYDIGTGDIKMIYNRVIADGEKDDHIPARQSVLVVTKQNTGTWKTAVVRVSDAALRNSAHSSSCSFGFSVPANTPLYDIAIKEVRVIKADQYD